MKSINELRNENRKELVKFLNKRGSPTTERFYAFAYYNEDNGTAKTAKFRLTKPSDITIGVKYNVCQLQKAKFMGFHLEDSTHATIVDSEYADYMLIMPMLSENGYVFNVEEREVVKTEKTYALVEVA